MDHQPCSTNDLNSPKVTGVRQQMRGYQPGLRLGTFCEIRNRLLFKLQILQPVIGQILHFQTGTYRLL